MKPAVEDALSKPDFSDPRTWLDCKGSSENSVVGGDADYWYKIGYRQGLRGEALVNMTPQGYPNFGITLNLRAYAMGFVDGLGDKDLLP